MGTRNSKLREDQSAPSDEWTTVEHSPASLSPVENPTPSSSSSAPDTPLPSAPGKRKVRFNQDVSTSAHEKALQLVTSDSALTGLGHGHCYHESPYPLPHHPDT